MRSNIKYKAYNLFLRINNKNNNITIKVVAQTAGAVEYTDCSSAEEEDHHPNECPVYEWL